MKKLLVILALALTIVFVLYSQEKLSDAEVEELYQKGKKQLYSDWMNGVEKAKKTFKTVIKNRPKHSGAYCYLAMTYKKYSKDKSELSHADKMFEWVINYKDSSSEANLCLGFYYYKEIKNDPKESLKRLERAVQLEPKNQLAVCMLGMKYYNLGKIQKAFKILEPLSKADYRNGSSCFYKGALGSIYYNKCDNENAQKLLYFLLCPEMEEGWMCGGANSCGPIKTCDVDLYYMAKAAGSHYQKGMKYAKEGETKKAIKELEWVKDFNPNCNEKVDAEIQKIKEEQKKILIH